MTLKSLKTLMTLMPTPAGVKFNTSGVGGLGRAPFWARKRPRSLTKSEALRAFNNRGFSDAASEVELSSTPDRADAAVGMAEIFFCLFMKNRYFCR